jgi:AcrR family transcriptional regulator
MSRSTTTSTTSTRKAPATDGKSRQKPASGRKARKLSEASLQARAVRAARNREELLLAAAHVVGESGYRDASVQRITAAAGLAQGTFYLYFPSRQALFDELLPHFGLQMLEHVRGRMEGTHGFFEVEEIGLRAVFEYLSDNPWFWRVLNEAEVEAPNAWARHHAEVTQRYVRFLKRAKKTGELKAYSERELATLAQLLVAARDYIYRSHLTTHAPGRDIPSSIVKTYRRFVEFGLGDR